jgi:hypothetical protein
MTSEELEQAFVDMRHDKAWLGFEVETYLKQMGKSLADIQRLPW